MGETMTTLVVDFGALDQLRNAIERSLEDAEQQLQTLTDQVRHLTTLWEGAASDGFQRTVTNWLAAREDLQRQLEFLRTVVVTAHQNHAAAVSTNTAMWRV
jgi:WXG100 family type VII secretion target